MPVSDWYQFLTRSANAATSWYQNKLIPDQQEFKPFQKLPEAGRQEELWRHFRKLEPYTYHITQILDK